MKNVNCKMNLLNLDLKFKNEKFKNEKYKLKKEMFSK